MSDIVKMFYLIISFNSEKKKQWEKQYYLLTIDEETDAQRSDLCYEKEAQVADTELNFKCKWYYPMFVVLSS